MKGSGRSTLRAVQESERWSGINGSSGGGVDAVVKVVVVQSYDPSRILNTSAGDQWRFGIISGHSLCTRAHPLPFLDHHDIIGVGSSQG